MHVPVLLDEVLEFLAPRPGGVFVDATFGAAGHSRALLEKIGPGGKLLALDRDEAALRAGRAGLEEFGGSLVLAKANFRDLAAVAAEHGFAGVDGILADLGVSSMMLDDPERGFSFMREGPLDMRMDRSQPLTAADVLNTSSESEIADILFQYGEERRSRVIARWIVRFRPLATTADLARAVERAMGRARYGRIHPATRTFQALRIFVNDELGNLEIFLDAAMDLLRPGGRLAVISFHSLEDRIVKNRFRAPAVPGTVLTKKVVTASDDELSRNVRSRSAKLRAWEKK